MEKLSEIQAALLNEDEQHRKDAQDMIEILDHVSKAAMDNKATGLNSISLIINTEGSNKELDIPFNVDTYEALVNLLKSANDDDNANESNNALEQRSIRTIAREISEDWKNVNYAAKPYLDAMFSIDKITDNYYQDSAISVVSYFLANASSWRGEKAKEIKAELKSMIKSA